MNRKLAFFAGLFVVTLMVSAPMATSQALTGTLTIKGSSTVFPVMEEAQLRWAELHPDVTIDTASVGSGGGMAALIEGSTDIAPMSRAPKDSEIAEADFEVNATRIGLDALAIIVHKDNPLNDINASTLTAIYTGNILLWSELGVDVTPNEISIHERDQNSGTHDYFNEEFVNEGEVNSENVTYGGQFTNQADLNSAVASTVNAIGYSGLAYVDSSVKALTFEGVEATIENAADDSYGVSRPLFLVTNADEENELRDAFVNYILSPEGQYIVELVGYVAIEEKATGYTEVAGDTDDEDSPFSTLGVFFAFFAVLSAVYMVRRRN